MAAALRHRAIREALHAQFADVRLLHVGARFWVFGARQAGTDRKVAIKAVKDSGSAWHAEVLDHEAAVLEATGPHRNIVAIHQRIALDAGRPALVFERSRGSLADRLERGGTLSLPAAVSAGIRLAAALDAVHAAGFAHCDVRPANVLVGDTAEPLLSGFEEATELSAADATVLHVTTPHTAPELLEGKPPTAATDVYGLACTLYELIAGRAAFRAYAGESPARVVVRVLSGGVQPIVGEGIPLDVSDLLTWALAGEPAHRPPTPAWLAEELHRIERRQGWPRTEPVLA